MRKFFNFAILALILVVFRSLGFVFRLVDLFSNRPSSEHLPETLRLYRRVGDTIEFAWFYEFGPTLYIDRGVVGAMAEGRNVPIDEWAAVEAEIAAARDEGFDVLSDDDWQFVDVVYPVENTFGSGPELDKRNAVTDLLDEHFALTGQGYWVDASSGMGTMETGFLVVDATVARRSIVDTLKGTEFDDYSEVRVDHRPQSDTSGHAVPVT